MSADWYEHTWPHPAWKPSGTDGLRFARGENSKRGQGRTHGTHSAYAHGCRCDQCREAAMIYQRNHRARQRSLA